MLPVVLEIYGKKLKKPVYNKPQIKIMKKFIFLFFACITYETITAQMANEITTDKPANIDDIEYKNDSGEWKYLEVKAMSDNQFIISGSEKEKGISEPDKFEMALVNDRSIYMVKDIFKFKQGEAFESNSKFVAYAKDYVILFDIN